MGMTLTLGRAVVAETYRPDSSRRFSVDLNRPSAYWRPLTQAEHKIDFAAMEIADGNALQVSRMRLGLILAAQMTQLVEKTRVPSLRPAQAGRIELPLIEEVQDEFFRLSARAYWDGTQIFDRARVRSAQLAGMAAPSSRAYGLSALGVERLRAKAAKRGTEFCDSIRKQLAPVFDGIFSPAGIRMKPQAMLEGEIHSVYAKWIDVQTVAFSVQFKSFGLDTDTAGGYEAWESKAAPVTDWLEVTADRIKRSKQPAPSLKTDPTALWLETERTRGINAGITAAGLKSFDTVAFQYTALRDGRTCAACRSRDGIIRDKNDDFWVFNEPPLHYCCRCHRVPVFSWEPTRYSTDKLLDTIDTSELGPGFGRYDARDRDALRPTMRAIQKARKKLAKPAEISPQASVGRIEAARVAMDRAAAEHARAAGQVDIYRMTLTAEELAYLQEHGAPKPGTDLARATERARRTLYALERATVDYQNATRKSA